MLSYNKSGFYPSDPDIFMIFYLTKPEFKNTINNMINTDSDIFMIYDLTKSGFKNTATANTMINTHNLSSLSFSLLLTQKSKIRFLRATSTIKIFNWGC